MISPEWSKRLEFMEHEVDLKLSVLQRRIQGHELEDWRQWEQELQDADIARWEELW